MSRIVTLIALALAAAALAASIATADTGTQAGTTVDPLAVSMLLGKGYTPQQVEAWTTGACSHPQKPSECFGPSKGANLADAAAKVDPLAQSYLLGQGLTPDEVTSWTVGSCSHETKAASCYAMLQPTATIATGTIGFHWGDAGIGAAATLGILLLLGGLGVTLISRRGRPDPTAHA